MSGSYGIVKAGDLSPNRTPPPLTAQSGHLRWFAIQTRYRFEKRVASQLTLKSIDVYLPLRTERHTWADRQSTVTIPLFPGYAFVHISQYRDAWQPVLQTAGVIGFVSFGGAVVAVPSKQITDLQLLLQQKVPFSLYPFVSNGRRVRIRGGCLDGLVGVVQHDKGKLVVSVDSIQRSLAIELQGYELELV